MRDLERRLAAARGCQEPEPGAEFPSDTVWLFCIVVWLIVIGVIGLVTAWCG